MNPSLANADCPVPLLVRALEMRARRAGRWRLLQVEKRAWLFDQDIAPGDLHVLMSGLVKLVFLTPQGDERIKNLIVDQGVFAVDDLAVRFGAQAIKPSELVRLPIGWVRQEIADDMELGTLFSRFSDWVRSRKAQREQTLLCRSATERYLDIRQQQPNLIERLPQGDIAHYLGITPIAFSRIKRRIGTSA